MVDDLKEIVALIEKEEGVADMSELPSGWAESKLTEVCELNPRKPDANQVAPDTPVTFVPMAAVDATSGTIANPAIRAYSSVAKGFTSFQEGDVIMAKITPCMENGKAAIARGLNNGFGFGSTEFHVFRPAAATISEYIFHFIRQESFRKLAEANMTGSVGQKRVPAAFFGECEIPLPPLNEQRRIVATLGKLLGKVNTCQQRLENIPRILKRFRRAVLAAACSGRLTADWREMNSHVDSAITFLQDIGAPFHPMSPDTLGLTEFPESWAITEFGTVVASIHGGSTAVPQNEPTDFPILRSSSVRPGFVDLADVKYISEKDSQNESNHLSEGDLLFTRLSGSLDYVANCAKVRGLDGRRIQYPDRLFCAKLIQPMSIDFCELVFASPFVRELITENAKSSAGHQRVSISDITKQPIPIAPLAEQEEIVRRVKSFFQLADQLEAPYQRAKAHVNKLQQSIIAKAFRGELVPQDPNDEPASVLLECIRAERAEGMSSDKRKKQKPATVADRKSSMHNRAAKTPKLFD